MAAATCWLMSSATGTGAYWDPFQQIGAAAAPGSPQVFVRWIRAPRVTPRVAASLVSTECRAGWLSLANTLRLTVTTHDVRFATSGRPWSSTISPRGAGMSTSRTALLTAAAW